MDKIYPAYREADVVVWLPFLLDDQRPTVNEPLTVSLACSGV